jgi:hypothetical protein
MGAAGGVHLLEIQQRDVVGPWNAWIAPFVCGEIAPAGSPQEGNPLAPGSYRTAIMVLNGSPGTGAYSVVLSIANPFGQPDGPVVFATPSGPDAGIRDLPHLGDWRSVEIDCQEVRTAFEQRSVPFPKPFAKGLVRISMRGVAGRFEARNVRVYGVYSFKNVEPQTSPNQP